jgi:prephenate dehydrogenase
MSQTNGIAQPMGTIANVVGAGLIGGSVGMALRERGWQVVIDDVEPETAARAIELGAGDRIGFDPDADITFIATPVGSVAELAVEALSRTRGPVTDVGSTKLDIVRDVGDPRFVGGHPMAGSEQDGIDGARANMFDGAMWVLTPTESTDELSFSRVRSIVRSLGAESATLPPRVHDQMVAHVSHVPHLTAASLMCLADEMSIEHRALFRLAAGGFRDMTRISAGRPSIWPDICIANKTAIVAGLDGLISQLSGVRDRVAAQDRDGILDLLNRARAARVNLPAGVAAADQMVEVAVPIPDRPGEIATIATLASELDVNIFDLEITHSGEGRRGVMMMVIDRNQTERLLGGLIARGYRPTSNDLS